MEPEVPLYTSVRPPNPPVPETHFVSFVSRFIEVFTHVSKLLFSMFLEADPPLRALCSASDSRQVRWPERVWEEVVEEDSECGPKAKPQKASPLGNCLLTHATCTTPGGAVHREYADSAPRVMRGALFLTSSTISSSP